MSLTKNATSWDELEREIESIRVSTTLKLHPDSQKSEGQFFTPLPVAKLLAAKFDLQEMDSTRILDPGAGVGSLGFALIQRIVKETSCKKIEIKLIEKDKSVIPALSLTFERIADFLKLNNMAFEYEIINDDFFEICTGIDFTNKKIGDQFDLIIMNPPYGKMGSQSSERLAVRNLGVDSPNLYSGFITLALQLLTANGSIVAITPRSFMNGPYFRDFRIDLLKNLNLKQIHLFDSRSTLFSDTGVLQENIIFMGVKQPQKGKVEICTSRDHVNSIASNKYNYEQIVKPTDSDKFIYIPNSQDIDEVISLIDSLPNRIADIGLNVSTGRVVDFRVKENLFEEPTQATAPLIYPGNFQNGEIKWPMKIRKAQAISLEQTALLLPNERFILIKRFSSKEERRRVVAAIWEPDSSGCDFVAFENHLNVIHMSNRGLERDIAVGLLYWLNSTLVDKYFRVFSGHTQVNATDLRSIKFPTLKQLAILGKGKKTELPSQDQIDLAVSKLLQNKTAVA